jgi:hypothetical protein
MDVSGFAAPLNRLQPEKPYAPASATSANALFGHARP